MVQRAHSILALELLMSASIHTASIYTASMKLWIQFLANEFPAAFHYL